MNIFPKCLLSLDRPWCTFKIIVGVIIGCCSLAGSNALASGLYTTPQYVSVQRDSKAIYDQAVRDYFDGRNFDAKKRYESLSGTDYSAISAVPAAVNLIALGDYSQAKLAFINIQENSQSREREYAQLWELWITAKQWKGNRNALNQELQRLVNSHNWQSSYMHTIAGLYAGQETVENVFRVVAAINNDAAREKDAYTEATFFTGGYLQNVKHNGVAARKLFNSNLNELNRVSLERTLIEREIATLKKPIH